MKFNILSHHKLLVVKLHSVLFGFWSNLASHLERSAFKQRFACCTFHSMFRLQSSLYIRVWAFAAPLPLLTHPASLSRPGFILRGKPVRPGKAPLVLSFNRPYQCTLGRDRPGCRWFYKAFAMHGFMAVAE